ncbi:riboflavin transporter RibU, partial [Staphylococcus cohnii]
IIKGIIISLIFMLLFKRLEKILLN